MGGGREAGKEGGYKQTVMQYTNSSSSSNIIVSISVYDIYVSALTHHFERYTHAHTYTPSL